MLIKGRSPKPLHNIFNCSFYRAYVEKIFKFVMMVWEGNIEEIFKKQEIQLDSVKNCLLYSLNVK